MDIALIVNEELENLKNGELVPGEGRLEYVDKIYREVDGSGGKEYIEIEMTPPYNDLTDEITPIYELVNINPRYLEIAERSAIIAEQEGDKVANTWHDIYEEEGEEKADEWLESNTE